MSNTIEYKCQIQENTNVKYNEIQRVNTIKYKWEIQENINVKYNEIQMWYVDALSWNTSFSICISIQISLWIFQEYDDADEVKDYLKAKSLLGCKEVLARRSLEMFLQNFAQLHRFYLYAIW